MPDGNPVTKNVDATTNRMLYAKVVDNILNVATFAARVMGTGEKFSGKTYDVTLKTTRTNQGKFFAGAPVLPSATTQTLDTMQFSHGMYSHPIAIELDEAFQNSGKEGVIDLKTFKTEEAVGEATNDFGKAIYTGHNDGANQIILGLNQIIDDGTNYATIGGLSRAVYPVLKSTVIDAANGALTRSMLAAAVDAASGSGMIGEEPTLIVMNPLEWSAYEQLLGAQTIARYADIGYKSLGVRGKEVVSNSELKGAAGFTSLQFRGIPVIKDAFCPKGTIYVINENYYKWRARTIVPTGFDKAGLEKISLGESKTTEGAMAKPSEYNGFFSQPLIWQSDKAALIGRLYAAGQFIVSQPRRHSKIINVGS